jgi:hypothetical protein
MPWRAKATSTQAHTPTSTSAMAGMSSGRAAPPPAPLSPMSRTTRRGRPAERRAEAVAAAWAETWRGEGRGTGVQGIV